jgi:enediyne biosynthesis protein E5
VSTEHPPLAQGAGPTGAAAAAPAAPARKRFRLDQSYVAPLLITCILLGGHLSFGILESFWLTGLAIATAIGLEIVLGRLLFGKWPHLASAYISGISVGILVRSNEVWPYALCAAITIVSKYVLRVKGRHIWNPSNFGIAVMLFLAPAAVATLSVQWDNRLWAMLVIWLLGSVIIWRLKRFHICLTYVLSFLFFGVVRSAVTGLPLSTEIAPITGPMYQLFTFFMITDPKTTVHSRNGQILVAFLVALMEAVLRLLAGPQFAFMDGPLTAAGLHRHLIGIHAAYYALFIVGPAANLVDTWMQEKRKKAAGAVVPA